jgi:hypothetical protein
MREQAAQPPIHALIAITFCDRNHLHATHAIAPCTVRLPRSDRPDVSVFENMRVCRAQS